MRLQTTYFILTLYFCIENDIVTIFKIMCTYNNVKWINDQSILSYLTVYGCTKIKYSLYSMKITLVNRIFV